MSAAGVGDNFPKNDEKRTGTKKRKRSVEENSEVKKEEKEDLEEEIEALENLIPDDMMEQGEKAGKDEVDGNSDEKAAAAAAAEEEHAVDLGESLEVGDENEEQETEADKEMRYAETIVRITRKVLGRGKKGDSNEKPQNEVLDKLREFQEKRKEQKGNPLLVETPWD